MQADGVNDRWLLLGELTELCNSAEVLLHWVVWRGFGVEDSSPVPSLVTFKWGATQLVDFGTSLVNEGAFGDIEEVVAPIFPRARKLFEQRNRYVHSLWTNGGEDASVPVHESVRDALRSPGERTEAFDVRRLRTTVHGFRRLLADLVQIIDALDPGLREGR